jgi:hypothetical protein
VAGALLVACSLLPFSGVAAQTDSNGIAQSFATNVDPSKLVAGAIVTNVPNKTGYIDLATINNVDQLLGVVDTKPLVSLSSDNKKIPVVLAGTTTVLVSDINGTIKSGDKITASPVAGVGMLATANGQIVGTTQADFKEDSGTTRNVTDKDGKIHTIHIQSLPIQVGVAYYNAPGSNFLPPFVQNVADSIAGRPVSLIRILLGTVILAISLIYAVVTAYSSTKSTISALGRNPLGSKVILRGQYRSFFLVFLVVAGALLTVYFLLVL